MVEVSIFYIFDDDFVRSFIRLFETNKVITKVLTGHKGRHGNGLPNNRVVNFFSREIPKFEPLFAYNLEERFILVSGHLQILYLING